VDFLALITWLQGNTQDNIRTIPEGVIPHPGNQLIR
jgi:hypothetical protein